MKDMNSTVNIIRSKHSLPDLSNWKVKIALNNQEQEIIELLRRTAEILNVPAFIIGGFVRDKILQKPTDDIDVVCAGDGILFAETFARLISPTPNVEKYSRYGTAMVRYENMDIEFVGARKESYHFDSRNPEVSPGTLEDDQLRRDFTINAMAIGLNKENFGNLIDPFDGLKDIERRIIRTPTDPGKTFSDDPLRMMRAIRFATQLDYTIEEATFEGIKQHAERIKIISGERIKDELQKIVSVPKPSPGFKLLKDSGLLAYIFPEMDALYGVEVKNGIGHKDNFFHTLEVLDNVAQVSDNVWLRWAAIMHDIAKPLTKKFEEESGWTFHGHDALGASMTPRIFRKLKLPLDHKMKYVQKLVALHLRPIALTKEEITDSAVRRLLFEAGEDIEDLMTLCYADITSKNRDKVERYRNNYNRLINKIKEIEEKDQLRNWQPPISGEDIMEYFQLPPGRLIGEIKTKIREAILEGHIPNERQAAFDFMRHIGAGMNLQENN